MDHLTGRKC